VATTAPVSIDNTGNHDVTVALSDWLATTKLPSDRTLKLRRTATGPGVYKVNAGAWGRRGETTRHHLDLNGCWLITDEGPRASVACPPGPWTQYMDRMWPRGAATLHIEANTHLFSSRTGARIAGGARTPSFLGNARPPDPRTWAIGCRGDARYEAQHGVRIAGPGCLVDAYNIDIGWTYGDPVYVEWQFRGTEIKGRRLAVAARESRGGKLVASRGPLNNDGWVWEPALGTTPGLHHSGRQLLSCSGGGDLYVHDITLWHGSRSCFDFEPGAGGVLSDLRVVRTVAGAHQGTWVAAYGNGSVNNVELSDNLTVHQALEVYCIDSRERRRKGWRVLRNVAERKAVHGSPLDLMRFHHVDGVVVAGNHQYIDKRQAGRGVETMDCTGVSIPDVNTQFVLV
jgi:hypothetical protein